MEIKNIKISFLVLAGLIVLSYACFSIAQESSGSTNIFIDSDQDGLSDSEEKAYGTNPANPDTDGDGYTDGVEINSGYDPLKSAPGDKIVSSSGVAESDSKTAAGTKETGKNLTNEVAKKIYDLTKTDPEGNAEVTMEDVQALVDKALNPGPIDEDLPAVSLDEIRIKKQDYSRLSKKEAQARKKEDFSKYIASVYYILSSNSPSPITSSNDISKAFQSMTRNITSAIASQNLTSIKDIGQSAQKTLDQMKAIEVPSDLVELHIKGVQFAKYGLVLQSAILPDSSDPLAYIASLAKLRGFAEAFDSYISEVQSKFDEFGFEYDESVKNEIEKMGLPALDEISTTKDETSDSSETTADSSDN